MDALNIYKLIHKQPLNSAGLEVSLLLEEASREYVLRVYIKDGICVLPEATLLTHLVSLHNYYQCLITPPIVAAPQVELVEQDSDLITIRSKPGVGKITGRTRLKIEAKGSAIIVTQMFRKIYRQQTFGVPSFSAESELGGKAGKLFRI